MKLLLIYCKKLAYTPAVKAIEHASSDVASMQYDHIQAAFIHVEEEDVPKEKEVAKKLVKNLKWICGKNQSREILLHSFAHLSESKATPEFTKTFFDSIEARLNNAGYTVHQTPFGYFLDLELEAPGFSLARVFKNIE